MLRCVKHADKISVLNECNEEVYQFPLDRKYPGFTTEQLPFLELDVYQGASYVGSVRERLTQVTEIHHYQDQEDMHHAFVRLQLYDPHDWF